MEMGEIGGSNVIDRPVQSQLFAGQLTHVVYHARRMRLPRGNQGLSVLSEPVKITLGYIHGDLGHVIGLRR